MIWDRWAGLNQEPYRCSIRLNVRLIRGCSIPESRRTGTEGLARFISRAMAVPI
jgi:hypothetical protein